MDKKIVLTILISFFLIISFTSKIEAVPALPTGYYGYITNESYEPVSGIQVIVKDVTGAIVGQSDVSTEDGIYSLNVLWDDPETQADEGVNSGNTIYFYISNKLINSTKVGEQGSNNRFDLGVKSADIEQTQTSNDSTSNDAISNNGNPKSSSENSSESSSRGSSGSSSDTGTISTNNTNNTNQNTTSSMSTTNSMNTTNTTTTKTTTNTTTNETTQNQTQPTDLEGPNLPIKKLSSLNNNQSNMTGKEANSTNTNSTRTNDANTTSGLKTWLVIIFGIIFLSVFSTIFYFIIKE